HATPFRLAGRQHIACPVGWPRGAVNRNFLPAQAKKAIFRGVRRPRASGTLLAWVSAVASPESHMPGQASPGQESPDQESPQRGGTTIKLLTVNVHKGFTLFNRRFILHELKAALRDAGPD